MTVSVVTRNLFSRLGAKVVSYPLSFLVSVLLVRYLGVERLGEYNYASTFAALFGLLASLGLPILLTREIARDKASAGRLLGSVVILQCGLSALTAVVIAGSAILFNEPILAVPISILGLSVALSAMSSPYWAALNGFEKIHLSSGIEVIGSLLWTGLILLAIYLKVDVTGLVGILMASPIVVFLLTKAASDRYCVVPQYRLDPALIKRLLAATLPFSLMVVFNNLYLRIDIIMLEKMQGEQSVGLYSAAYKIVDVFMLLGTNIGVLYPRMAAQAAEDRCSLHATVRRAWRYMTAIGMPVAMIVATLAPWIVWTLYGQEFSESAAPLRVLAASIAFMFMAMPLVHALNAMGREWYWIAVLLVNTAVNVGLNFLLIPTYGYQGAAVSTVVCELVGLILVGVCVHRDSKLPLRAGGFNVIAASLCMAVPLWQWGDSSPLGGLVLGLAVYGAVLYALGFFNHEEKVAVQRFLGVRFAR